MNKFVIFDCDDVLCDTSPMIKRGVEEILGREVAPISQWNTWHLEELFPDLNWESLKEWIIDGGHLKNIRPSSQASHVVNKTKEKGYSTAIVTARDYFPESSKVTAQWAQQNNIPIDYVFSIAPGLNKADFISKVSLPVHLFIDDHSDHIIRCARKKIMPYPVLMDRPWNQHCASSYRVKNLEEIFQYL